MRLVRQNEQCTQFGCVTDAVYVEDHKGKSEQAIRGEMMRVWEYFNGNFAVIEFDARLIPLPDVTGFVTAYTLRIVET